MELTLQQIAENQAVSTIRADWFYEDSARAIASSLWLESCARREAEPELRSLDDAISEDSRTIRAIAEAVNSRFPGRYTVEQIFAWLIGDAEQGELPEYPYLDDDGFAPIIRSGDKGSTTELAMS